MFSAAGDATITGGRYFAVRECLAERLNRTSVTSCLQLREIVAALPAYTKSRLRLRCTQFLSLTPKAIAYPPLDSGLFFRSHSIFPRYLVDLIVVG